MLFLLKSDRLKNTFLILALIHLEFWFVGALVVINFCLGESATGCGTQHGEYVAAEAARRGVCLFLSNLQQFLCGKFGVFLDNIK